MKTNQEKQSEVIIKLAWSEGDKKILIEDKEEEGRYFTTVEEAIRACRAYDKSVRFKITFEALAGHLIMWAAQRQDRIKRAFLTVQDRGLLFLVVTNGKKYDDSFEDELTTLDVQVANSDDFSDIELDVQSLPDCSADNFSSFCHPGSTIQLKF